MAEINAEETPKGFPLKLNGLKTCLPSNGIDTSSPLAESFERCSYFVIADLNRQEITSFVNYVQTFPRGESIQTAQMIIDQQVETVIVPEIDSSTLNILQKAGIKIFLGIDGTIQENIDLFSQGRLVEIKISN
ncbi:MAG: NifB/NifX family molybdenum-iron cluster-binding protein [Promethearchaeota archaeon]